MFDLTPSLLILCSSSFGSFYFFIFRIKALTRIVYGLYRFYFLQERNVHDNRDIYGCHYDEGRITRCTDTDPVWALLAQQSINRYKTLEANTGIMTKANNRIHSHSIKH